MAKRGATVVNFVLLIALLIIGLFVMTSLQRMAIWQGDQLEQDIATSLIEKIYNSIETAKSYPSGATYEIKMPGIYEYELRIDRNTISVYFPELNQNVTKSYILNNINVIPSTIKNAGKFYVFISKGNLLLDTELICNPSDGVCDPGCIVKGICDKDCYTKDNSDICLGTCVDYNRDGRYDRRDSDNICDPDCYNNERNGGVYDFDCLNSGDGICDPDTNFIKDDYCDLDCIPANGICDPDCGLRDIDCYRSGICNPLRKETCGNSYNCRNCTALLGASAECKTGCHEYLGIAWNDFIADYECVLSSSLTADGGACEDDCECLEGSFCDNDRCCPLGQRNSGGGCKFATNDGVCDTDIGENCFNAPADCLCSGTEACCPLLEPPLNDDKGCTDIKNQAKNNPCACSTQCSDPLLCIGDILNPGTGGGCCEIGERWDKGTTPPLCTTGTPGVCDHGVPFFETCETDPADCDCAPDVCCPQDPDSGKDGCAEGGFGWQEPCSCQDQCSSPLYCSGKVGDKHCCNNDELWNSTECEDQSTLKILFVPIESPPDFDDTVDNIETYLESKLFKVDGTQVEVDAVKMSLTDYDIWKNDIALRTYWDDMCGMALLDLIKIGEWYDQHNPSIRYNYVMGICPPGEAVCNVTDTGTAETLGCAGYQSVASIIKRDPAGSDPQSHRNYKVIAAHELGHNLGLAHIEICNTYAGCFGFNKDDCLLPSAQKRLDIMTYCDNDPALYQYNDAAREHYQTYPLYPQTH